MNNHVMPSIIQMETETLRNLVKQVKETVATGIELPELQKRSFGIVDLWNIRRNAVSARSRFSR